MKRLLLLLFCLIGSLSLAFTVDEIKDLKTMGFTNEQILELQKEKDQAGTRTQPTASQITMVTPEDPNLAKNREEMAKLREKNSGLIVVCASKDWTARGPGFLGFRVKYPNGNWGGLGQADRLEYFMEGRVVPVTEHTEIRERHEIKESKDHHGHKNGRNDKNGKDDKNDKNKHGNKKDQPNCGEIEEIRQITTTRLLPIITSRYMGRFVLNAGTYEFELERAFNVSDNEETSAGKSKRHKKFFNVPVQPGMVTVLSYFWQDNAKFGLDHPMPTPHINFVRQIADQFGDLVSEIRVQHN